MGEREGVEVANSMAVRRALPMAWGRQCLVPACDRAAVRSAFGLSYVTTKAGTQKADFLGTSQIFDRRTSSLDAPRDAQPFSP